MVRVSVRALIPFWQRRAPVDFRAGYNNLVQRTVSDVVAQSTPIIAQQVTPIVQQSIFSTLLTLQTDFERGQRTGKGGGFNTGFSGYTLANGAQLQYGQGLANIGGAYYVTNEAGRGGSTAAAKAILASYNKYKSS